jgi:hypothetical protein
LKRKLTRCFEILFKNPKPYLKVLPKKFNKRGPTLKVFQKIKNHPTLVPVGHN